MPKFNPRALRARARRLPPHAPELPAPPNVDLPRLLARRLAVLREEMARRDIAACVLFDAVNIRRALGARNMRIFTSRLCVKSYVGAPGEPDGVKLEEQVLITEDGCEVLSRAPHDEALDGREF